MLGRKQRERQVSEMNTTAKSLPCQTDVESVLRDELPSLYTDFGATTKIGSTVSKGLREEMRLAEDRSLMRS